MLRQLIFLGVTGGALATVKPNSIGLGLKIDNEIVGAKAVPVQPRTTARPAKECDEAILNAEDLDGMREHANSFSASVSVLTHFVRAVYGASHCQTSHTISLSRLVSWYRFVTTLQSMVSVYADPPSATERIGDSMLQGIAKPDFSINDIQPIMGGPVRHDRISRGVLCAALLRIILAELDGLRVRVTAFAKTPLMVIRTETEKSMGDAQKLESLLRTLTSSILYSPPSSDLRTLLSDKALIPEELAMVEHGELISTYVPSPLRDVVSFKMSQKDTFRQVMTYLYAPLSDAEMNAVVALNSFIFGSLGRYSSFTIPNPSEVALVLNQVATADTYVALLCYLKGANSRWVSYFDETDDEADLMSNDGFSDGELSPDSV